VYHAAEMLLILAPLICPQELRQSSRQKLLAEDSLSCSEVTDDYTLDAISGSTEILFNFTTGLGIAAVSNLLWRSNLINLCLTRSLNCSKALLHIDGEMARFKAAFD